MEGWLVLICIWVGFWLLSKIWGAIKKWTQGTTSSTTPPSSRPITPPPSPPQKTAYRPKPSAAPPIRFKDASPGKLTLNPTLDSLSGLHDAFTGAPLDPKRGLYRCSSCQVYYHSDSYEVLRDENRGRCVACLGTSLVVCTATPGKQEFKGGRDYAAQVVTLNNYRSHIGHVVTFEGHVPRVNRSRDGRSYAVMFENTTWKHGLKMIVFRGAVAGVGGSEFLLGLRGHTIRIRGLLSEHGVFGYQIIVKDRGMILEVR